MPNRRQVGLGLLIIFAYIFGAQSRADVITIPTVHRYKKFSLDEQKELSDKLGGVDVLSYLRAGIYDPGQQFDLDHPPNHFAIQFQTWVMQVIDTPPGGVSVKETKEWQALQDSWKVLKRWRSEELAGGY